MFCLIKTNLYPTSVWVLGLLEFDDFHQTVCLCLMFALDSKSYLGNVVFRKLLAPFRLTAF